MEMTKYGSYQLSEGIKMVGKPLLLIGMTLILLQHPEARSQSDDFGLNVFGYFQTTFDHTSSSAGRSSKPSNSFYLQQLNLMASNELTANINAFVNFELTNTYSSSKGWGSFSIQEAWVKYRFSNELNVKGGLSIPVFNNLNEIKNRTPLLPFIFRPLVYETSVTDIFPLNELVPEQAFLQVYGFMPIGEVKFDYAVYVGNGDQQYTNASPSNYFTRGADTTLFKMVGGRVGVRTGRFKAGVSMTADKENGASLGLGPVPRYRFGADLSFEVSGLSGEFEIITVNHAMTPEQTATLGFIAGMNPALGTNLNKYFYYGLLSYDISEQLFGYAGYNYLRDKSFASLDYGLQGYTVGGGFRVHSRAVVKGQYIHFRIKNNPFIRFREDHFMVAISVFF